MTLRWPAFAGLLAAACSPSPTTPEPQSAAQPVSLNQSPAPAALAGPCMDDPRYREFDFWAGEWDVATPDGTRAGQNSITIEQGGCLLMERWTPASGNPANAGVSMNFYDPLAGKWRQVWSSPSAHIDYVGGLVDGAMTLEGEIFYQAENRRAPFRGVWTKQDDGSVRQHFQEFDPAANAWTDWFIGVYRRKAQP